VPGAAQQQPPVGPAVVAHHPQLAHWPGLHLARADLLGRLGRRDDAALAYRAVLQLDPTEPERRFIHRRLATPPY